MADIRLARMRDLAFVRSALAHARIRSIAEPAEKELQVFIAQDLTGRGGKPPLLTGDADSVDGARATLVDALGLDAVDRHMQLVIFHRALQQAGA